MDMSDPASVSKYALIAAMPREVASLVRNWRRVRRDHDSRPFVFYEFESNVLVCGGIGPAAARRAAVAAISIYHPRQLVSVGFAGALDPALAIGDILCPQIVINAADGSRIQSAGGQGTLVSFSSVAGAAQKASLGRAFQAQAVDMEASAVALAATAGGLAFSAVKAISDELDFEMPLMARYIDSSGQFQTGRFALAAALRPWLWNRLRILAANSGKASKALCDHVQRQLAS